MLVRTDGDGKPTHGGSAKATITVSEAHGYGMIDVGNQDWLDALWETMESRPVEEEDYFGNTLKLMAMIAVTGHWASP